VNVMGVALGVVLLAGWVLASMSVVSLEAHQQHCLEGMARAACAGFGEGRCCI